MNESTKIEKVKKLSPFVTFCQKVIPLAFDESMSYYECLCSFVENLNSVDDAIVEIQEVVIQMKEYMDHYFDNLDVQEEINNKLDEMAESGELESIISAYLQISAVLGFDSVADMQDGENFVAGSFAETYGYYAYGDEGGAKYKIREVTNQDVVDGVHIIALNNFETLIAELIRTSIINVKVYGAKGDGETDDTDAIKLAIADLANSPTDSKQTELYFPDGTYIVSDTLDLNTIKNSKIYGKAYILAEMAQPIFNLDSCQWLTMEDLYVRNTSTATGSCNLKITASYIIQFNNMYLRDGDIGVEIVTTNNCVFNNTTIRNARINIYTKSVANNTDNVFNGCAIEDGSEYNFYLEFDRPYYGNYNFNDCYFEYSNICMHTEQNYQIYLNNCYTNAMANNATLFEVNHTLDSKLMMRNYLNGCRITAQNEVTNAYLVKSLNANIVGGIQVSDTTWIKSSISMYNANNAIKGYAVSLNPRQINLTNGNSLSLGTSNIPTSWKIYGSTPTFTAQDPYFEGAENSITFGASNGYIGKEVYLEADVTYLIEYANKAGTGTARFDIFDKGLTSRYVREDTTSTNPTIHKTYFTPTTSGTYAILLRNTNSSDTSSFGGLKLYSYKLHVES